MRYGFDFMPPRPEKRAAILEAAYVLLLRDGPGAFSMDTLAVEAGVSKPTIYTHFGSRADLCRAMVADLASELVHDVEVSLRADGTVADRISAMGTACLGVLTGERCTAIYRMLMVEGPRDPTIRDVLARDAFDPTNALIAQQFERMLNAGELRGADASGLTGVFLGIIKGAWLVPVLAGVRPPLTHDEATWCAELAARTITAAYAPR